MKVALSGKVLLNVFVEKDLPMLNKYCGFYETIKVIESSENLVDKVSAALLDKDCGWYKEKDLDKILDILL